MGQCEGKAMARSGIDGFSWFARLAGAEKEAIRRLALIRFFCEAGRPMIGR